MAEANAFDRMRLSNEFTSANRCCSSASLRLSEGAIDFACLTASEARTDWSDVVAEEGVALVWAFAAALVLPLELLEAVVCEDDPVDDVAVVVFDPPVVVDEDEDEEVD